jgi:HD-like signal output (HDOD) protein
MGRGILFVDDEQPILKALERLFFDTDFDVLFADSGAAGLELLSRQSIDIVVSDMKMPVMSGHQFLHQVKEKYPGVTRIILSGFATENELFASIIDGSNSLYLMKPWKGEELKDTINRVFVAREKFHSNAVLEFVNSLENLAMLPGIYNSVCALIEQDADASAIAVVIEQDVTVTAAVLRVVNSAFFNIQTASVVQAITFLGLPVIKSIVLSCSLLQSLRIAVEPFNVQRIARHAMKTNFLVAAIYKKIYERALPDSFATAGLLHNIGFVMLLHYYPEKYRALLQKYLDLRGELSLSLLEKEYFGVSHDELGGYLLNWWAIPFPVVESALFHNSPLQETIMNPQLVMAVHLASYYAWQAVLPRIPRCLEEGVFIRIGVEKKIFENMLEQELRG